MLSYNLYKNLEDYLVKYANFNSFEPEIKTSSTELIEILQKKDPRLNQNNAIIYFNDTSPFGGVYIDKAHDDKKHPLLYTVDIIPFENVLDKITIDNETTTDYKAFVGVVAIFIQYEFEHIDEKGNLIPFSFKVNKTLGKYGEVFPAENNQALEELDKYTKLVTVEKLALEYVAPSFLEALDNLGIAH